MCVCVCIYMPYTHKHKHTYIMCHSGYLVTGRVVNADSVIYPAILLKMLTCRLGSHRRVSMYDSVRVLWPLISSASLAPIGPNRGEQIRRGSFLFI